MFCHLNKDPNNPVIPYAEECLHVSIYPLLGYMGYVFEKLGQLLF